MPSTTVTSSPAEILKYRNELVRTGKVFPLGRMIKIAIAPAKGWNPNLDDKIIRKYGRLIDFRDQFLPIAFSPDRSMILVTAPLLDRTGRVSLPEIPDPDWVRPAPTKEEIEGIEVRNAATGRMERQFPKADPATLRPHMLAQRLEDRAEGVLAGTDFLIFSPVVTIAFQPELKDRLVADAWLITAKYSAADDTQPTLLIHRRTGETHFFGGLYKVEGNVGE